MSKDNAIVILQTSVYPQPSEYTAMEYRVKHLHAFENIFINKHNLFDSFEYSVLCDTLEQAIDYANYLQYNVGYIEHGIIICDQYRNKTWEQLVQ